MEKTNVITHGKRNRTFHKLRSRTRVPTSGIEDQTRGKSARKIRETKMIENEQNFIRYVIKCRCGRCRDIGEKWSLSPRTSSSFHDHLVLNRDSRTARNILAFKWSRDERMKKRRKSEEKHIGTSEGTRMEERVARGDVRGILLEIQRDVNILLYIEPERTKWKSFPRRNERGIVSSALSEIPLSFIGAHLIEEGEKRGHRKAAMQ